jgi:hypothetical protein
MQPTTGRRGRPFKKDWLSLRSSIEKLIAEGAGLPTLARHFSMSRAGIRRVLARLGLRTLYQREGRTND